MIEHEQMDTKTSRSLPYKHGLCDRANAQKHVIYECILKYTVNLLFILWTTGVHKDILKLQQHLCSLHRTKGDFQVGLHRIKVTFQEKLCNHVSACTQCIILPLNVSSKYLTTKQTVKWIQPKNWSLSYIITNVLGLYTVVKISSVSVTDWLTTISRRYMVTVLAFILWRKVIK
jgi:hypothetical protein